MHIRVSSNFWLLSGESNWKRLSSFFSSSGDVERND